MENFQSPGKGPHAGDTIAGTCLEFSGIPVLLRSLVSMIGIGTRTKQCPFCENTLRIEACICQFCNKILMREIHLGSPGKNCGRLLK